ncbi:MAG: hypothetical protein WDZ35_07240 [Crocinitomicaceae bacterium]
MRIIFALVFLTLTFVISVFFEEILSFLVVHLKSGWVFGSVYVRLLVIISFTIALFLAFSLFEKTKKIRFVYVFLIALLPAFGISFISPIYDVDYGMFDDDLKIAEMDSLSTATNGEFTFNEERIVAAFFTTGCPHCKAACRKLAINKKAGQQITVHTFFSGNREDTDRFLKENNGEDFNSYLVSEKEQFMQFSGTTFPSVFVISPDGETEMHFSGDMINYTLLDYLLELSP